MKSLFFLIVVLFLAAGCAKNDSAADDTTSTAVAAAMTEVGDVAGTGTTGGSLLLDEAAEMVEAILPVRTSCSGKSFSDCASGVKTRNFSDTSDGYCTRGQSNSVRTYGKALLTFANPGPADSCDFDGSTGNTTTPPSVTRTLEGHYMQLGANGRKLLVYTGEGTVGEKTIAADDLKDFEGTSRSGGAIIKKITGGDRKLTISGIHRRGVSILGKYTLWHTLWSDADAITITGSRGDRTLNGTMYVMHNRVQKKITKTLTDVKFTSSCRFPISGTTNFTSTAGSVTVTWTSSCGTATIDGVAADVDTAD